MGEDKSSRMVNYDSSYFSKKMTEVDKKGGAGALMDQPLQSRFMKKYILNQNDTPSKIGDTTEIQLVLDKKSESPMAASNSASILMRQGQN